MSEQKTVPIALFPVYLYEEGVELPKTGTYYVVAKDGIYVHVERAVGSALVKANEIPWLKEAKSHFHLTLPKIPGRIIGQAWTFFNKVFSEFKSESYLQLYYSEELNQYRLWCPKQKVSFGGVEYERDDQFDASEREGTKMAGVGTETQIQAKSRWKCVGTIHSHCNFSAFHSGTDTHDESTFDGIHITLGHVDKGPQQFSMVASIAINDNRVPLEPENCCCGDIVRSISRKVKENKYMHYYNDDTCFFGLNLSEEDQAGLNSDAEGFIENEWMPKVEKRTWQWSGGSGNFLLGGGKNDEDDENEKWFPSFM